MARVRTDRRRILRRPRARTVVVLGAAAGAASVAALELSHRRWAAAHDASGGDQLGLPPGTHRTVTAPDGAELAVLDCGPADGPVVLLSHCWTGDRRIWGPVARRLVEQHCRVVLYDQRGHGASSVGDAGLAIEALGDDLGAVIDQLDLKDVVVAGHSMGGMSAQSFALRHPEVRRDRVKGIVLVATAASNRTSFGPADRLALWAVGSGRVHRAMSHHKVGPVLVRGVIGRDASIHHLRAVTETFTATPTETRVGFLRAMHAMDLTPGLAVLDTPTTVLCGTRDALTPIAESRRMAAAIPGAALEELPGFGHMLPNEAPDQVADAILEHVRR